MTPEELIAWHAHQITFLPKTPSISVVQLHRDAMHCVERMRAELRRTLSDYADLCEVGALAKMKAERDALLRFHEHVCIAANMANTCPELVRLESGRAIRNILRDALENYAAAIDAARKGEA
jgi:hypothetical protein